ncbi:unnamed protein product [Lathyrus sativus]|nr:unnamed protein product [Lathyrus sativus]
MASSMEKTNGESTIKPNWLELPLDLTKNILQRLDSVEIITSARNVCPMWWNICKDPFMWRSIDMSNIKLVPFDFRCLDKICRCGHLEDIAIESFGTDDLLKHVAHRASNLKRLKISCCNGITDEGLIKFVTMFSLLEDLQISFVYLSKDSLEVIGQNCPLLNSLYLEVQSGYCILFKLFADQVFAIAKTMFVLRHLAISGIWIHDRELLAILDGCPLLGSLDIPTNIWVNISESVKKRWQEQIKDLQLLKLNYCEEVDDHDVAYKAFFLGTFANDDSEY